MLDKTIQRGSTGVAMPNSPNLHSAVPDCLQKHRLARRADKNMATENCLYNPLTHSDHYRGRTALLTSTILYIYSTYIGTEYFKHGIYSMFFSSSKCSLFHNSNVFGSCIIHILYTGVLKLKKNNSGTKRLTL